VPTRIAALTLCVLVAGACKDDPPPPPSVRDKVCARTLDTYAKVESSLRLTLWAAGSLPGDAFCSKAQLAVKGAGTLVGGSAAKQLKPVIDGLTDVVAKCTAETATETQNAMKTLLSSTHKGLAEFCAK
jgi:hypothetical protein